MPPSPSLGLGFPGCEKETGARKLCFWEQVLLLRNEDKAQHWGRGGRGTLGHWESLAGCDIFQERFVHLLSFCVFQCLHSSRYKD